jgi:hypothetical protein
MVTAGRDGTLQFWKWNGEGIVRARPPVRRTHPLLAVAASPDGHLVACLDSTGEVAVLDLATGGWIAHKELRDSDGVGHTRASIAFNSDGSRLAFFGSGGQGGILAISPFERALRPFPAKNVTALLWHPGERNVLLLADGAARYHVVSLPSRERSATDMGIRPPRSVCTAIVATPDRSRWFLLEKSGRFVVVDPECLGEVFSRQGPAGEAQSLCISSDGTRLGVVYKQGFLVIWDTR